MLLVACISHSPHPGNITPAAGRLYLRLPGTVAPGHALGWLIGSKNMCWPGLLLGHKKIIVWQSRFG